MNELATKLFFYFIHAVSAVTSSVVGVSTYVNQLSTLTPVMSSIQYEKGTCIVLSTFLTHGSMAHICRDDSIVACFKAGLAWVTFGVTVTTVIEIS